MASSNLRWEYMESRLALGQRGAVILTLKPLSAEIRPAASLLLFGLAVVDVVACMKAVVEVSQQAEYLLACVCASMTRALGARILSHRESGCHLNSHHDVAVSRWQKRTNILIFRTAHLEAITHCIKMRVSGLLFLEIAH